MSEVAADLSKPPNHQCYEGSRLACFECFRAEREHRLAQTLAETPAARLLPLHVKPRPLSQRTTDHRQRMLAYLQSVRAAQ